MKASSGNTPKGRKFGRRASDKNPSRTTANERLAVQFAVSQILLETKEDEDVIPSILRTVGEGLDWDYGAFWKVDSEQQRLQCQHSWQKSGTDFMAFDVLCRTVTLQIGEGLPGRIWKIGKAQWIANLAEDVGLARQQGIAQAGFHSGVCFPVSSTQGILGVIEFFSGQAQDPNPSLVQVMITLGNQLGQSLDRKNQGQELRESEARFRKLAESAPVLIWISGRDKLCTYLNRRWLEFTGRGLEDALGNGWAESLHAEDLTVALNTYVSSFESRQEFKMEYRLRHHDGEYRWVLDHGIPIFRSNGEFTGYIGSCIDIHDQKLMAQELEKKVAERTEALERASLQHAQVQAELHQARNLEAVGRLAGGVAHDFNNLMTGILGVCEDLLGDANIQETQRGDIQEISKAASRAAALTKQLLAFGRRQIVTPKVLGLNHVISDMESLLRRLIGADIELAFFPDSTLGNARIDPGQVEQILVNLVMNSRDAMPNGGSVTIETQNVEFNRNDSRRHFEVKPGPYVMLAVSDTGAGMDPEVQAHAFEPFYTTKKEKGTGLGLARIYGIVKQNSGDVFIYSDAGKGTTVKVYLPRVAEAIMNERAQESLPAPGGTETILIVEDEDIVRRVAVRALTKHGYKVLESRHGKEALEICASYGDMIHLMLTDVIMPGMNGRQLAELLASSRPELKVLYMSGYTENVIVNRGILKPGISFIEKTFTAERLCLKVRKVLDLNVPSSVPE